MVVISLMRTSGPFSCAIRLEAGSMANVTAITRIMKVGEVRDVL
jgi:hypothetical protein